MTDEKSILVMDDDESFCEVMKEILTELGYRSSFVNDGKRLLEKFNEAKNRDNYDLVILDLKMGKGMSGEEVAKELLQNNSDVKIVLSTGFSNLPIIANYKEYGIKGVLLKPYNISKLKKLLEKVL